MPLGYLNGPVKHRMGWMYGSHPSQSSDEIYFGEIPTHKMAVDVWKASEHTGT